MVVTLMMLLMHFLSDFLVVVVRVSCENGDA